MKLQFLLLILLSFIFTGCSVQRMVNEADGSLRQKEYYAASEKYKLANQKIKDKKERAEINYKMAECYRQTGDYTKSAISYRNAIRLGYSDSTVQLRLADALRATGKPDEAKVIYDQLLKRNEYNQWALNGIESVRRTAEWKEIPELYILENLKTVNSASTDVISQIMDGNPKTICFTSSRGDEKDKNLNPANGQHFADFYSAKFDSVRNKWSIPDPSIFSKTINSTHDESAIYYNSTHEWGILSRTVFKKEGGFSKSLYYIKKEQENRTIQTIPFSTDGASYFCPMIASDDKTIWFASDRKGGKGELDIWKTEFQGDGQFSEPMNAGELINTPGNECYPFEKVNGYFYFSSDFHPGLGGYDIFQAQNNNGELKIIQLPPPVNSIADDLAIRFKGKKEEGYLSSNRKGSRSYDIYSFYLPPKLFQCRGKIHDSETDATLSNVNVKVVGSDGSSQKVRVVNGQFVVDLFPESDYALVVFANGYLNAQAKLSTKGLKQAKEFEIDIPAVPTGQPIQIENIFYETGKWDLLPLSKPSLDRLIDLLKFNPEAIVEIASHTDDIGSDVSNFQLSERRAKSVVDYLVENGIPGKNLQAKPSGESVPLKVSLKVAKRYPQFMPGTVLSSETIEKLGNDTQKELARSLNRRTEFRVLETAQGSQD